MPLPSPPSRRPSIVVLEDTAHSFSTFDGSVHVEFIAALLDQLVFETLVIPLEVTIVRVLLHHSPKVTLAEWNDLGQTLRHPDLKATITLAFSTLKSLTIPIGKISEHYGVVSSRGAAASRRPNRSPQKRT